MVTINFQKLGKYTVIDCTLPHGNVTAMEGMNRRVKAGTLQEWMEKAVIRLFTTRF